MSTLIPFSVKYRVFKVLETLMVLPVLARKRFSVDSQKQRLSDLSVTITLSTFQEENK